MLKDNRILARIIEACQINEEEIVYEAGTGNGVLTEELCKKANLVKSFEADRQIFRKVRNISTRYPNLELINADIFNIYHLEFDVFISNLPYSRSKDALQWLSFQKFKRAIIMTQREFADKLQANPGEKNYRAITVLSQYCFSIERLFNVSKEAFYPKPSIESTLIRLVPRSAIMNKSIITKLNFLFSQRNKNASTLLKRYGTKMRHDFKKIDQLTVKELMEIAAE